MEKTLERLFAWNTNLRRLLILLILVVLGIIDLDGVKAVNDTQANHCDQRIRALFQESGLKQQYGVDFSMGLAILTELPENLEDASKIADQLMYESKSLGKSQTTIQTLMNTEPAF